MQSSYMMELPVLIRRTGRVKSTGELLAAELILRYAIQEIVEKKKKWARNAKSQAGQRQT